MFGVFAIPECSSVRFRLLRTSISLLSDLEQTAAHKGHDVLNARALLERIKKFEVRLLNSPLVKHHASIV